MADEEEKTEDATSKKIEDAKKEGNVPKSTEVPGAAILFFSSIYLLFFSGNMFESIKKMMLYIFNFIGQDIDGRVLFTISYTVVTTLLTALSPLFILVMFLAIVFNLVQFGFVTTPLKFKFDKLDPISGFKNVFSLKKLLEAFKLFAKLTIIFVVMVMIILFVWDDLLKMMDMQLNNSISLILNLIGYFLAAILLIVVIFAIIDFFFTRYYYFKQLKMSKQEIKEEFKQMEGDPQVKGRIRQIQMKMAKQRMLQDVSTADVVITNPTHYAVALKYKKEEQSAPIMVAKGVDFLAIKIKDIAREHKIPIVENPAIARALYDQTELEEEVPQEFYKAIAEIFAYVYELNK